MPAIPASITRTPSGTPPSENRRATAIPKPSSWRRSLPIPPPAPGASLRLHLFHPQRDLYLPVLHRHREHRQGRSMLRPCLGVLALAGPGVVAAAVPGTYEGRALQPPQVQRERALRRTTVPVAVHLPSQAHQEQRRTLRPQGPHLARSDIFEAPQRDPPRTAQRPASEL